MFYNKFKLYYFSKTVIRYSNYYFFTSMFPMFGFAPGSMPGLAGWPVALLIGFLLIVANMISVYLFIKVAGNRPWEWFEDGSYGPGDEG